MSFFSSGMFQPTIYDGEEYPIDLVYKKGGIVADILTPWEKDFNKPAIFYNYPDVYWDNKDEEPSRMTCSWRTMYLVRIVCDSTTLINIAKNSRFYLVASEGIPNRQSNMIIAHNEYWRLRDYMIENGMSHAEAAFYIGTNNTMKTVSNNIRGFLNEIRSQ